MGKCTADSAFQVHSLIWLLEHVVGNLHNSATRLMGTETNRSIHIPVSHTVTSMLWVEGSSGIDLDFKEESYVAEADRHKRQCNKCVIKQRKWGTAHAMKQINDALCYKAEEMRHQLLWSREMTHCVIKQSKWSTNCVMKQKWCTDCMKQRKCTKCVTKQRKWCTACPLQQRKSCTESIKKLQKWTKYVEWGTKCVIQ